MVAVVATVCVQRWFHKRRALASGLLYCGLSLGSFIWVPIIKILIGEHKIYKNDLKSKLTLSQQNSFKHVKSFFSFPQMIYTVFINI